jgi:hypothetical protein
MGKLLAFGKRGTYNPANREKESAARRLVQVPPCALDFDPGVPARKPGIPKQDPKARVVPAECGREALKYTFPRKAISRWSKEPL